MKKREKIVFLEQWKGLFALLVVLHHSIISLLPAIVFGDPKTAHFGPIELKLGVSPLSILWVGHSYVAAFFVLSGFFLSLGFYITNDRRYILQSIYKRYIRLCIPVAITLLFIWVLIQFQMMRNVEASNITLSISWLAQHWQLQGGYSFWQYLKEAFWTTYIGFDAKTTMNANLWMMQYEFIGSIGSLLGLYMLSFAQKWWMRAIIYCSATLFLFPSYYFLFPIGIALSDWYVHSGSHEHDYVLQHALGYLLMIIGFFGMGYPTFLPIDHSIYRLFSQIPSIYIPYVLQSVCAAIALLGIVLAKPLFPGAFGTFLTYVGKLSFYIYLIHIAIIGSLASYLIIALYAYHVPYAFILVITLLTIYVGTIGVSQILLNIDSNIQKKIALFFAKKQ